MIITLKTCTNNYDIKAIGQYRNMDLGNSRLLHGLNLMATGLSV